VRKTSVAILGVLAVLGQGCADSSPGAAHRQAVVSSAKPAPTRIGISIGACGVGWEHPRPGRQRFVLSNTDTRAAEVLLMKASGEVVGYVESLGPGAAANLRVDLGSGRYKFRCAMQDADVVSGPTVAVPGGYRGGSPAVLPVSQAELIGPTQRYERYVKAQLPRLLALVRRLDARVRAGDLAGARLSWLPAHLEYERLGAAYGAFGSADSRINGFAQGLALGVHDPRFTGFHRIEYGLWHGQSSAELKPYTAGLVAGVRRLAATIAEARIDPLQVSIRAHEIVENTLQFELTGQSDYGSRSGLATARANLDGTAVVLRLLTPLLKPRYAKLHRLQSELAHTRGDLDSLLGPHGWPSLDSLATRRREQVNADFAELSELLAPVASICEPRLS
jgi:iron uptake system component EfeO